jgi:hypothetical protein
MAEWPSNMKTGPIREWPGTLTPAGARRVAPFTTPGAVSFRRDPVPITNTLELLNRELRMIGGRDVELLVAIAPDQFRIDGQPHARAKASHPGVILALQSKHGQLSYPCDTFTTWQSNLRAIALALEALRKVDRYGVTSRGEQYRGFLALEATAMPSGFADGEAALAWLLDFTDYHGVIVDPKDVLRTAQRKAHPDRGGAAADFHRVSLAEAAMREGGLL